MKICCKVYNGILLIYLFSMKKIIVLAFVCMSSIAVYGATSPVVQVVSYKEPLGLYYLLQ